MSTRSIGFSFLFLSTALFIACIVWRVHHQPEGPDYRTSDAFSYWKSLRYVPIGKILEDTTRVHYKNGDHYRKDLTLVQLADLEMLGGNMLKAYSRADYNDFIRFRFPVQKFHFKNDFMPNVRKMMQATGVSTNNSKGDMEVFEWWWRLAFQTNQYACAKCWEEASPDSIHIVRVEKSKDTLTRLSFDISSELSFEPTIFPSSIADFDDTPESILQRQKHLLVAVISITLKETGNAYRPIYVESYWSENAQRWLPRFLGMGQYAGASPIFSF